MPASVVGVALVEGASSCGLTWAIEAIVAVAVTTVPEVIPAKKKLVKNLIR